MSAPGEWLAWFLEEEDAWQFAVANLSKHNYRTKTYGRWHVLVCAIDARRRESLKNFRAQCAPGQAKWDGCGAWFEVQQ